MPCSHAIGTPPLPCFQRCLSDQDALICFVRGMPKVELHIHIEGAISPDLAKRLAKRNNLPLNLPTVTAGQKYVCHDLKSFLPLYYSAMSVLKEVEDFDELATDYLRKMQKESVRHIEMFFDPQAHMNRGVEMKTVVAGLQRAIRRAEDDFGINAKLIMCFLRDHSVESAMQTLDEMLKLSEDDPHIIAGVGLDSDEKDNPPSKFDEVFQRVRDLRPSWRFTVHCDIDQPGSIDNIRHAVDVIRVDRIDHGTNIVEDESLIEVCKRRGIGLTTCPISNDVVYPGSFKKKEIMQLLRQDVLVSSNSDDPSFHRYLTENLELLVTGTDITKKELVRLQENAIEMSWISHEHKSKLLKELHGYVEHVASDTQGD